jgi:uncharacterized Zn-finger protein
MTTSPKEVTYTEKQHISCEGYDSLYDHPMIYLEINEKDGKTECPYCGNIFILKQV